MSEQPFLHPIKNKKTPILQNRSFAVRTGLEPATPGVTGLYSNQLNFSMNYANVFDNQLWNILFV